MSSEPFRVVIIAEIGSVHDGSLGNAKRLISLAARCGADAVKFQTHIAQAETTRDAPTPSYFKAEPRFEYFERTSFSLAEWRDLRMAAEGERLEFLSSPFSLEAVDLLEEIGVSRYKIPSGEVTNLPMLDAIARTGRPVLLSSGMSSWDELDRAVEAIRRHTNELTVLQCTSEYPCPPEHVGLNVLAEMRSRYGTPVGLSDHTLSVWAPIAATVLGATVIEKHLTFSRQMYGSDAAHSLEPAEFTSMVDGVRAVSVMLGSPIDKSNVASMATMKATFEKSVVTRNAIRSGDPIAPTDVAVKKPGTGLPPEWITRVVGKPAARDLPADAVIIFDDILWGEDPPPRPSRSNGGPPSEKSA